MAVSNTIKVTITGDAKALEAAAKEANASVSSIEKTSSNVGAAAKKALLGIAAAATAAFTAASGAAFAFAKDAVSVGMEFDSSMSQVVATMGYSVDELNTAGSEAAQTYQELRDFAQEMGSTTAFSAVQASEALNYMALAGYDAETSMKMLPNVLNLAAAGGIELAKASDMVTDAQTALGLSLDETNDLVNYMASAASSSNTSVEQLGEAILTVGGTAQFLAGGAAELSTALGVLADNGIKGSEAGTHLRNMLLKLSAPTEGASALLNELGVEVFDAEGKMRSLDSIFWDLREGMEDFTDEQRINAFSEIFNTRDVASAMALLNSTTEEYNENIDMMSYRFADLYGDIVYSKTAAEDMANVQLDNLQGDVTLFQSALEGAKIALSDSLTPTLREFVQIGSNGLSEITSAFKANGVEGAAEAVSGVLEQLLGKVSEVLPDVLNVITRIIEAVVAVLPDLVVAILPALSSVVEAIIAALPSLITTIIPPLFTAIVTALSSLVQYLPQILQALLDVIIQVVHGIIEQLPTLLLTIVEAVMQIVEMLTQPENLQAILEAAIQLLLVIVDAIPTVLIAIIDALPDIITNIIAFLTSPSTIMMIIEAAVKLFMGLVLAVPKIIGALIGAFGDLVGNLWNGITGMFSNFAGNFGSFITDIFKGAINGVLGFIENFINAPVDLLNGFIGLINGAFGWIGVNIGYIPRIGLPRLETGGIIPGNSYSGDQQLVRVNSGEMVINRSQQAALWNAIETGNFGPQSGGMTMGDVIVNVNVTSGSNAQEIGDEVAVATVKAIRRAFRAQGVEPLISNAGALR